VFDVHVLCRLQRGGGVGWGEGGVGTRSCVSTPMCNGLVIYGRGLKKKKKDKPVFSNDKVITFLLFFQ
jgi:hypothetical protein